MQKLRGALRNEDSAPQYPIESVDNALRLLLLLGETPGVRLTDARQYLGVASSTAHRLLAMLQWRGFVRQDAATKIYRPGPALTTIAFSILQRMDAPRVAKPILDDLSVRLGETVHLGQIDGASVRFLAVAEPSKAVRVASRLDRVIPAHCTSTGKMLLSELHDDELDRIYPSENLPAVTSHSITSREELRSQLAKARQDGFAINREESEDGVASVAVLVPTNGDARYALNLSAPVHRLPLATSRSIAAELARAAEQLAELLA